MVQIGKVVPSTSPDPIWVVVGHSEDRTHARMRQQPPREVLTPSRWFGESSSLPQKQPLSPTLVGGGRLPAAGDFKRAAVSLQLGWVPSLPAPAELLV